MDLSAKTEERLATAEKDDPAPYEIYEPGEVDSSKVKEPSPPLSGSEMEMLIAEIRIRLDRIEEDIKNRPSS